MSTAKRIVWICVFFFSYLVLLGGVICLTINHGPLSVLFWTGILYLAAAAGLSVFVRFGQLDRTIAGTAAYVRNTRWPRLIENTDGMQSARGGTPWLFLLRMAVLTSTFVLQILYLHYGSSVFSVDMTYLAESLTYSFVIAGNDTIGASRNTPRSSLVKAFVYFLVSAAFLYGFFPLHFTNSRLMNGVRKFANMYRASGP